VFSHCRGDLKVKIVQGNQLLGIISIVLLVLVLVLVLGASAWFPVVHQPLWLNSRLQGKILPHL